MTDAEKIAEYDRPVELLEDRIKLEEHFHKKRRDCLGVLPQFPANSVDFILADPPYLARYVSRDGRTVPNDDNDARLKPAFKEMFRVLRRDSFAVSFYGWPHVDRFMQAWREAGFRIAGHFVFPKRYTSAERYVRYQHECAYLLAKGNPQAPQATIGDVIDWTYSGNKLHPTQKPLPVLLWETAFGFAVL
jgi:DNA modification methylase